MMIMSVGSGEVIARVLPELGALLRRPLATIERVRVRKRDGVLLERPHELPPTDEAGNAIWQKMMVYTSESARHKGEPIHRAVIRQLRNTTAARGATTLRGIWGFHGDHLPHGDKLFQLGRHVPGQLSSLTLPPSSRPPSRLSIRSPRSTASSPPRWSPQPSPTATSRTVAAPGWPTTTSRVSTS